MSQTKELFTLQDTLASNAFNPWVNGNKTENIYVGNSAGQPYIVRVSDKHWLPINAMVFADSKEEAVELIRKGLTESKKIAEQRVNSTEVRHNYGKDALDHVNRLLALMDKEENIETEPFDKRSVTKVSWGRSGIFG